MQNHTCRLTACGRQAGRMSMQHGTTLLEVLVSIVIFSFILLGVTSAELVSISTARDSNMRSTSAFCAESLAAMMRSNAAYWRSLDENFNLEILTAVDEESGAQVPAFSSTVELGDYDLDLDSNGCDLDAGHCSPAEMAITDIRRWSDTWVSAATNASAKIENIASPGQPPLFEITMSWRQKQRAATGSNDDSSGLLTNQYQTLVKL